MSDSVLSSPAALQQALQAVTRLHQLTLEAMLSESRQQLQFRVLNRTAQLCRYDRAFLWQKTSRGGALLGVSGDIEVQRQAPELQSVKGLVEGLWEIPLATWLTAEDFKGEEAAFSEVAGRAQGTAVVWVPFGSGHARAGLWLERWEGEGWQDAEIKALQSLAAGYGAAWQSFFRGSALIACLRERTVRLAALCLLLTVMALVLVRLPLRVVAPCEVVARNPEVVNAPLAGVISAVVVKPGMEVKAGDLLVQYDERVARQDQKVAEQQVAIIRARLQRVRASALQSREAPGEVLALENRLKQEQTRLELAEYRLATSRVCAQRPGVVMLEDAANWRGRPVQVGQRILRLVNPEETKVCIWLPEADSIEIVRDRGVEVLLNADPDITRQAYVTFRSDSFRLSPGGLPGFRTEAAWRNSPGPLQIGLKGHAILYGRDVPLWYFLFRKPLSWLRIRLGL